MKIIIMAAGRGTRISRHIQGKPKCCIDLNGVKLIHNTFDLLNKNNYHDIAIVTGYCQNDIMESLNGYQFTSYYNPFYDITNSIASLWFAKDFINLNDDLMLLNADVYFEEQLLKSLVTIDAKPTLLADSSSIEGADYKLLWEDEKLLKYGKELRPEETTGEYVGIAKIGKDFIPLFLKKMEDLIYSQKHHYWWENILYSFIDDGIDIFVKDIKGIFWAEVDFIEDYKRIIDYIECKSNVSKCLNSGTSLRQDDRSQR